MPVGLPEALKDIPLDWLIIFETRPSQNKHYSGFEKMVAYISTKMNSATASFSKKNWNTGRGQFCHRILNGTQNMLE